MVMMTDDDNVFVWSWHSQFILFYLCINFYSSKNKLANDNYNTVCISFYLFMMMMMSVVNIMMMIVDDDDDDEDGK